MEIETVGIYSDIDKNSKHVNKLIKQVVQEHNRRVAEEILPSLKRTESGRLAKGEGKKLKAYMKQNGMSLHLDPNGNMPDTGMMNEGERYQGEEGMGLGGGYERGGSEVK